MAGTDCGFGTFTGFSVVAPSVAWAKLNALAKGARLASQELWWPAYAPYTAQAIDGGEITYGRREQDAGRNGL